MPNQILIKAGELIMRSSTWVIFYVLVMIPVSSKIIMNALMQTLPFQKFL